jgi:hypothetical protein
MAMTAVVGKEVPLAVVIGGRLEVVEQGAQFFWK